MAMSQSILAKGSDIVEEKKSQVVDVCTFCASKNRIQPATHFCLQCGPCGRYICESCVQKHEMFLNDHDAMPIANAREKVRSERYTKDKKTRSGSQTQTVLQASLEEAQRDLSRLSENSIKLQKRILELESEKKQTDEISRRFAEELATLKKENEIRLKNRSDGSQQIKMMRATRIAEAFSELYDNGWTDAFEELSMSLTEREAISLLYSTVQEIYNFYEKEISNESETLNSQRANNELTNVKHTVRISEADMTMKCRQHFRNRLSLNRPGPALEAFIQETVKVTFWMFVQNPPLCFAVQESGKFDQNFFKLYTKSGRLVDFIVWPALTLHKQGPLLAKGVVQCKS